MLRASVMPRFRRDVARTDHVLGLRVMSQLSTRKLLFTFFQSGRRIKPIVGSREISSKNTDLCMFHISECHDNGISDVTLC